MYIKFLEQAINNYTHTQKHIPMYKDYWWIEREREHWGCDKGNNLKLLKIIVRNIHNYVYKVSSSDFYFDTKVHSFSGSQHFCKSIKHSRMIWFKKKILTLDICAILKTSFQQWFYIIWIMIHSIRARVLLQLKILMMIKSIYPHLFPTLLYFYVTVLMRSF